MEFHAVVDQSFCWRENLDLEDCLLHYCWSISCQQSCQTCPLRLVWGGLVVDGRMASLVFQLEVEDMMVDAVAAIVFVAVEPCKTFVVETEAGSEEQISVKVEK